MVRKADVKAVENLGGGKGTAYVHHIISKEEMLGHGSMPELCFLREAV